MNDDNVKKKNALDPAREFMTYFRRGYSFWLVLILGFGNFIGIWYELLGFDQIFLNLIDFILVAGPVVVILAALIGYVDIKRGLYSKETEILTLNNPVVARMDVRIEENSRKLDRILASVDKKRETKENEK